MRPEFGVLRGRPRAFCARPHKMRLLPNWSRKGPRISPNPVISPQPITGGPASVTVWSVSLNEHADIDQLTAVLDGAERSRASRFAFERDARRFIACRAAVRHVLGEALGASPADLTFEVEPGTKTKPRLVPSGRISFNVSNSADRAVIALADYTAAPALGVDLEYLNPEPDVDLLAARFFSRSEQGQLASYPSGPERLRAFYACWTRKEAVIKGAGIGLDAPLQDFDVDLRATEPFVVEARLSAAMLNGWVIYPLDMERGWAAALAVPGG